MKKILNWVMAATLVCGAMTLTACSNEDNDVEEALTAEIIAGLWVTDYDESGITHRENTNGETILF